jgi:preprotein translocase subunit SecB
MLATAARRTSGGFSSRSASEIGMNMPTQGPGEIGSASLNVLAQYTKDLSFENPNAPNFTMQPDQPPALNVQINVNAKPLSETDFEVELSIEGRAEHANTVLFAIELVYAGVFRVQNVPQESIHPLILIECPRLLFPFARQVIADTVREGGFPPLMLDPVDFAALYRQRMAQQSAQPMQPPKPN